MKFMIDRHPHFQQFFRYSSMTAATPSSSLVRATRSAASFKERMAVSHGNAHSGVADHIHIVQGISERPSSPPAKCPVYLPARPARTSFLLPSGTAPAARGRRKSDKGPVRSPPALSRVCPRQPLSPATTWMESSSSRWAVINCRISVHRRPGGFGYTETALWTAPKRTGSSTYALEA